MSKKSKTEIVQERLNSNVKRSKQESFHLQSETNTKNALLVMALEL